MKNHKDKVGTGKTIKRDMINRMVDLLDEAVMCCYYGMIDEERENTSVTNYDKEKGRLNYYECLFHVIDYLLDGKPLKVNQDDQEKIAELLDAFILDVEEFGINSEEIRRALLLLDIKAFKNINFPLDMITPDTIGIIMANFVDAIFDTDKTVELMDFNMGVGNLAFTVANHMKNEAKITAIENHRLLTNVVVHKANMMMQEVNMYYDDALSFLPNDIDIIVSDIAPYEYENENYHSVLYDKGVRYFPYLAIEHYLKIEKPIFGIYLIENSFFQKEKNHEFYEMINENGHIDALISLPKGFFQDEENAKSIIIISNKVKDTATTGIYMLPELDQTEQFLQKLEEICEYLKERKEELICK